MKKTVSRVVAAGLIAVALAALLLTDALAADSRSQARSCSIRCFDGTSCSISGHGLCECYCRGFLGFGGAHCTCQGTQIVMLPGD